MQTPETCGKTLGLAELVYRSFPTNEAFKGKIRSQLCNPLKISNAEVAVNGILVLERGKIYFCDVAFAISEVRNLVIPETRPPPPLAKFLRHNNLPPNSSKQTS
jgi:hypothetical protein